MAELNDKLITYGNLSTFYDKLQEQGLGGNAIEEVSELPEASENKDKLFRLDNGDKDVYAAKLFSSETITTNRLPDEQQIDKAYLIDANPEVYKYEGDWTIVCTDGNVTLKCWNNDIEDDKAFFTVDNAETITSSSKIISVPLLDWTDVDLENKSLNADNTKSEVLELIENGNTLPTYKLIPIPAIYNAPESAQIGNAYIETPDYKYVYNGNTTTITVDGVQKQVYIWEDTDAERSIYSENPASNIYGYMDDETVLISDTKFYRSLNSGYIVYDDLAGTLYIPQLNAPDSEQVDNAYVDANDGGGGFERFYYTGIRKTLVVSDGSLYAYIWGENTSTSEYYDWSYATTVPANEIYGNEKVSLVALDDYGWTVSGDTLTNLGISLNDLEENNITPIDTNGNSISTVKYQRTETTEEWGWQDIIPTYASDSDIDAMFTSPIVKRVLMKAPDGKYVVPNIREGLVNLNDETMEYDGQTYYKWVKYEDVNGVSVKDVIYSDYDDEIIVLTTSLEPTLPFSSSSPEWAYQIGSDSLADIYASPSSETYPKEALIHEDGSITYEE